MKCWHNIHETILGLKQLYFLSTEKLRRKVNLSNSYLLSKAATTDNLIFLSRQFTLFPLYLNLTMPLNVAVAVLFIRDEIHLHSYYWHKASKGIHSNRVFGNGIIKLDMFLITRCPSCVFTLSICASGLLKVNFIVV